MNVIPQVRMFFKAEGRANLFDMLRRIKTSARQTYTRCGTGSVVMFDYAESPLCTNGRFRISELTSNVPYAVRSTLRNDGKGLAKKIRIISVVYKTRAKLNCIIYIRKSQIVN